MTEDPRPPPLETEAERRSPDPENELTVVVEGDGALPPEFPKPAAT